jgi:hypothetical protein
VFCASILSDGEAKEKFPDGESFLLFFAPDLL